MNYFLSGICAFLSHLASHTCAWCNPTPTYSSPSPPTTHIT